jgi:hypothetical protein
MHLGVSITPSAALMRASIVSSCTAVGAATDTGFGVPNLQTFVETPFRFVDRQTVAENQHWRYDIALTNVQNFKATLVWNDPPLDVDALFGIFADLDLIVVGPDGTVYYGNGLPDAFATVEQVAIPNAPVGVYSVHVVTREWAIGFEDVNYSLVFAGGIDPDAPATPERLASEDCPRDCGLNGDCVGGQCRCRDGFAGKYCEESVADWAPDVSTRVLFPRKVVRYFGISRAATARYLRIRPVQHGWPVSIGIRGCLSDRFAAISDPVWSCASAAAPLTTSLFFDIGATNRTMALALYCISKDNCDLDLTWASVDNMDEPQPAKDKPANWNLIIWLAVAIMVLVAIGVVMIWYLMRAKGDAYHAEASE